MAIHDDAVLKGDTHVTCSRGWSFRASRFPLLPSGPRFNFEVCVRLALMAIFFVRKKKFWTYAS